MLNEFPTQSGQSSAVRCRCYGPTYPASDKGYRFPIDPCASRPCPAVLSVLVATPARADLHITRDHGGYVEEYKPSTSASATARSASSSTASATRPARWCSASCDEQDLRDAEGEPRFPPGLLRQGLHLRYQGHEFGRASDLMSYYPDTVKDWIRRNAGSPRDEEDQERGELWKIVDPCPEEW